ncbi:hypothetical protein PoB_002601300 [Plakobranchus ocellatus]|uniref:Uncharacterized protein n=1 Tax=Plakobranchus ocellatus TaxID=259542 RepID=A0AAV3ZYI5_9GAST|nr:hypothetical protein PoB_002601300 [Plakobranchus ocellatus]
MKACDDDGDDDDHDDNDGGGDDDDDGGIGDDGSGNDDDDDDNDSGGSSDDGDGGSGNDDGDDISGGDVMMMMMRMKRRTHLTGAYTNAKCLSRQGKKVGKILVAANLPEGKALIFSKKADVLFSPRSRIPDLETLPQEIHCERTGVAVMVKKGSTLPDWWNPAFRTFVRSGDFARFCMESSTKYNYQVNCLSDDAILKMAQADDASAAYTGK